MAASTLSEVFNAIEAKFGTSPTKDRFGIMKNVCDKLNNLDIWPARPKASGSEDGRKR